MIRTQIQLEEDLHEALRRMAFRERTSFAAVVRSLLARALGRSPTERRSPRRRWRFVGAVRGRARDVSVRHDAYLGRGSRW